MKLLLIYGAPGTGKLTVATELAATTGFKLFHNHLSISVVEPIFEFGTKPFNKLVDKIRADIIEEAAREKIDGLIFTFVYAFPTDQPFIERISRLVEQHGGEMCFVQLYCDVKTLEERVVSATRKAQRKIASVELLREVMQRHDLFTPIAGRKSLSIDNSQISPQEVVQIIRGHYQF